MRIIISQKRLIPLLVLAFVSGTCFSTCAEAQEKSKSENKKTPASITVSEKQLETWINQLSEDDFRERRAASNNLLKACKSALPALVKGTHKKDTEVAKRCFDIIVTMYRGKNKTLTSAARKALGELEQSTNKSMAQRAKKAIEQKLLEKAIDTIKKLGGKIEFDDEGIPYLVDLDKTNVTDADLVHLKGLTSLDQLFLNSTNISDAGLVHLKGLTKLSVLWLRETKITDAGLVNLKGMTKLDGLNISYTQITDAGLVHLKGLPFLMSLYLSDTKVSDASLKKFHTIWLRSLGNKK